MISHFQKYLRWNACHEGPGVMLSLASHRSHLCRGPVSQMAIVKDNWHTYGSASGRASLEKLTMTSSRTFTPFALRFLDESIPRLITAIVIAHFFDGMTVTQHLTSSTHILTGNVAHIVQREFRRVKRLVEAMPVPTRLKPPNHAQDTTLSVCMNYLPRTESKVALPLGGIDLKAGKS